ncbi:MFS transporter [Azospirillum rugosum]|uniref:MFS family permease n=1 Tax=Azospirillum rugosum TaxID=416170 RepID=A0ABS4SX94_9PROT|nr:MFS transporter [Azospirillum rugosum]MBP2297174.1 MFS family permease [Azospirillum rugosum]MDQ0530600.1 MFS family permease [Azospirillum rugosum]
MPHSSQASSSTTPVLVALILGICVIQIANGILQILLPLRLAEAAAPPLVVGAVASAYSVGFVAGCWAAPWLIRRIGGVGAFAAFGLLAAAATLALQLLPDATAWVGLRVLMGMSYVGMLTVGESGLAALAPVHARGSVFSLYMIACKVAVIGGQMLLASPGLSGPWLTATAALCYGLSVVPVAAIRPPTSSTPAPAGHGQPAGSPWRFVRRSPVAFAGCLVVGLCNTAVTGIGPAYLAGLELSGAGVALVMSGIQVGSVVLQWPIGRLSDRRDRRLVICGVAGTAMIAAFLIAKAGATSQEVLLALFTLWGSAGMSLYAICVAHANDHAAPEETVPLASAILLAWALGAALGPLLATAAMEWFGHGALFAYVGAVSGGLALFAALRRWFAGPSRPRRM